MDIKVTNIEVKAAPTALPVMVKCPLCGHTSEMMVSLNIARPIKFGGIPDKGTGESPCHSCGAVLSFDWTREEP